jgi:hypothetical protein
LESDHKSDYSPEGIRRTGYRHPRIGEPRHRRQPLYIDRLAPEVRQAIVDARLAGKTWMETAKAASGKAGRHIPASTVQRWHDLRIEQPSTRANESSDLLCAIKELISLLKVRSHRLSAIARRSKEAK